MGHDLGRVADPKQPGGKSGVDEIQFRAFDQTFGQIARPGLDHDDQMDRSPGRDDRESIKRVRYAVGNARQCRCLRA